MKKLKIVLANEEGLHARPAAIITEKAESFKSKVNVIKNGNNKKIYNLKSIFSVLSMGASKGDELSLIIHGSDEEKAAEELIEFLQANNLIN